MKVELYGPTLVDIKNNNNQTLDWAKRKYSVISLNWVDQLNQAYRLSPTLPNPTDILFRMCGVSQFIF